MDAAGPRVTGFDQLRSVLTVLVIAHHTAITYGGSGGWFYREVHDGGAPLSLAFTLFCSINQAFFMGLFFLLAGYFSPPALAAKGLRLANSAAVSASREVAHIRDAANLAWKLGRVVRGEAGRNWLAEALRQHGAQVHFVEAYRRTVPVPSPPQQALLAQALARPERFCWLFSSSEAVGHLPQLAPGADWAPACALAYVLLR